MRAPARGVDTDLKHGGPVTRQGPSSCKCDAARNASNVCCVSCHDVITDVTVAIVTDITAGQVRGMGRAE